MYQQLKTKTMETIKVFNNGEIDQKGCIELLKEKLTNTVPFIFINSGCFGTDTIMLLVSFDPKENWNYGYVENTNYYRMSFTQDGKVKVFTQSIHYGGKKTFETRINMKFRQCHVKSIDSFISKVNEFNDKIKEELKN